ncbi:tyrosine-protein phosphatase 10D-like isoform X1 [Vanessa cardui]|uniref:tyrosine-protein phosphatase 10D-like isoform X1 n=1 Tax=Vanessa cardui TaxID=171605 RepID=UPI001F12BE39|nr:tyrosine-protein phosphatase 10D-like isoform X1 [Vanessa cardui]
MLPRDENSDCLEEKVSYEIRESPSMMWKRSIVQAKAGHTSAPATLTFALFAVIALWGARGGDAADLVIEIPGWGAAGAEGAHYRLDYRPPQGSPAPNYTVPARASTINFQGLPGTKYHFMLYYSNATFADLLTWNQTIITAPEPPTNLTVTLGRNKQAAISWAPPAHGDYSGFRFKVLPLSERAEGGARNITVEGAGNWSHVLRDLSPGATYQLHAFTLLHDKESAAYTSFNFTTKPNTPGKFIVWFRNETTLLVLWQPPYPPGAYTHYKVSIEPRDARESELYVEKEGEPPGPAQAAFKGLVPGRAYDISVQTVSDDQLSAPTTAQYRTVPLRPRNVSVPARALAESAFRVTWLPPAEPSEFEKYQVSVAAAGAGAAGRRLPPQLRARDEPPAAAFDGLEPGAHYTVTVKTMSGKVTSWPATADLTLKPLPVRDLQGRSVDTEDGGGVFLWWKPADGSTQDEYKVSYHETGPSRDDSNTLTTTNTNVTLEALLPGRNYTVTVAAVSRGVESNESVFQAATRPLAPALRSAAAEQRALLLAWSSDVNSRQDRYELRYRRRDADAPYATVRPARPPPAAATGPRTAPSDRRLCPQLVTADTNATLEDLYPGAVYEIQLVAISHGLRSERHTVLKPVRPLPAEWLSVERATSNSVAVHWRGPRAGLVGAFVLRYRTAAAAWRRLDPLPPTADVAEIANMTHGERYEIQLDTASEDAAGESVDSGQPLSAEHTVRPNPVSNVAQLADTRNVTLEWPRPAGRVEWYEVRWRGEGAAGAAGAAGARNVSAEGGARSVRALLGELAPGRGYSVSIAAHSHDLASDIFTMHTRTRPLIQSEMTIVNESGDGDDNDTLPAILVLYTPTPSSASMFDAYRFRLEGGNAPARWQERPATPPDAADDAAGQQQVAFRSLTPGRLYNLTMWTVSHNVTSHPVQRQARLYPRPITELNATAVGAREISLAWARPAGDFTDFEVQYLVDEDRLETRTTDRLALTLTELRPYTLYVFTVVVQAGTPATILTRSRARSGSFRTLEAPPAAPTRFQLIDATPTELAFEWALPARDAHGVLTRFRIYVAPAGASGAARWVDFGPEARAGRVGGLAAGGDYELWLRAANGAGEGAAARVRQRMAIAAPPRPTALPAEVRRSSTTVAVSFGADYFSPANGNVTAYTLVLAEEPRADTPARLPSWRDVHRLPVWPPYQVTEPYYPFHSSAVEEFTIGSERCEGGGRSYCNGPLKPGSRYYVKLRAFTAPDKFTDTAYTVVYTEADNTGWIAGGAVCGALAAALLAGALLLRRRRARAAPAAPAPQPAARPVRVADFADHYRLMSADSDFRFSEEFEELKHVGREQPCTAADLPCNRPKNRFTNILPYDHSRYKLQPVDDEEGSDYINANYVPGHNSPREFIVTQGPLHCTRDDFWRMCWESGSRAIVMLTRCVEKGREKCDRYWPYDTRPVYYGDIAVTALNESRYPDWTVTELAVCRGAEQRVLRHFHFTTWPDFGVPDPPTALARFVRAFRERCPPDTRPVIVHCSAGVGRSGTFITLDRALQQLDAHAECLDIFGMVHAMRRERVWMVQTEQQYICIHQCVVAALEGADLAPPPPNNHHHNAAFEDDEGIAESGM